MLHKIMDKKQWLRPLPTDQPSFHGWIFAHTVKYGWNYEKFHLYLMTETLKITGKTMFDSNIDEIFELLAQDKIPYPAITEVTYA
jgi:hypothetical protein